MKNNFIYSIFIVFLLIDISSPQKKEYTLTNQQKKIIKQAQAMEASGLMDEAINIYINLLDDYPYIDEAFNSLKKIYIINNNIQDLVDVSDKYIRAHKFDPEKIINVFEIYLLSDTKKSDEIIDSILNNKKPNLRFSSKIISILLNYQKIPKTQRLVEHIRNNTKNKNFYSLQLGMYYSLQNDIKNAIKEYFVYLNNNKKNIHIISNRIMSLTDNNLNIETVRKALNDNSQIESKFILSELEFKLKNYNKSYELLEQYSKDDNKKIAFIKDLLEVNNFELSENIINSIIKNSNNPETITKAIFLLAQLFELKLIEKSNILPISHLINLNQILNSPFLKINENYANLLDNAISIYDSLSINLRDYKSAFHLAEIKYTIQGDLDGALILYNNIFNKGKSFEYKIKSLERIIDIYHSKGDLFGANKKINYYYTNSNDEIKMILDIKKIQNYFYEGNKDTLIFECRELLKKLPKNNLYYNDILDITSLAYLFNANSDFENYTLSKFKLIQNKRIQSINLLDSLNSESKEIDDLITYEKSYLNVLHGNYNKALDIIENIQDNSTYIEYVTLLKGEIFDYLIQDKSKAVDVYLLFLDLFPDSIYYDLIRLRLRKLADDDV